MSLAPCSVECIWTPLLPIGECAVVYAANYIPITPVCCAIAASISAGIPLPGETDEISRRVLYLSTRHFSTQITQWIKINKGNLANIRVIGYEYLDSLTYDDRIVYLQNLIDDYAPQFLVLDSFDLFVGSPTILWDDIMSWRAANTILQMVRGTHCSALMTIGLDGQVYEEKPILNDFGGVFSTPLANIYGSTAMHGNWKSVFTLDYYDNVVGTKYVLLPVKTNYSAMSDTVVYNLVKNKLTWLGTDKGAITYACGDLLDVWWKETGESLLGTLTPISDYYNNYITYCASRNCGGVSLQLFAKRICSRYGVTSVVRKDENRKSIRCYVKQV